MKINKAKLLVGTLAIAAVAATVGSISGTVAWFQYSTRVTAAYSGAAAHVSESLEIRIHRDAVDYNGNSNKTDPGEPAYDSGWLKDLSLAEVRKYIAYDRNTADYNLRPITSGAALTAEGKIAADFYKNPIYQYSGDYSTTKNAWTAADRFDYVYLPIELRVLDVNGANPDKFLAKDVFVSDVSILNPTGNTKEDITDAIRVSFDATNDVTFSINGGTIATTGNLDLNGDGRLDKEEGYEDFKSLALFDYGTAAAEEVTTKIAKATDENGMLADDSDPLNIKGKKLGTTTADGEGLAIGVRIYLEGWQTLETTVASVATGYANLAAMQAVQDVPATAFAETGANYKTNDDKIYKWSGTVFEEVTGGKEEIAVWNDDEFVSSSFNVGIRFSAEAHADHA
jgi:hypothetical protein